MSTTYQHRTYLELGTHLVLTQLTISDSGGQVRRRTFPLVPMETPKRVEFWVSASHVGEEEFVPAAETLLPEIIKEARRIDRRIEEVVFHTE